MNNKQREAIVEEFRSLINNLREKPLMGKLIFPNVIPQIKEKYKKVLYDKVQHKDHGLVLNQRKMRSIKKYAERVESFKDKFQAALTQTINDHYVEKDKLAGIEKKYDSSNAKIYGIYENMIVTAVKNSSTGTIVSEKELRKQLSDMVDSACGLIDPNAIGKCTSMRAIKDLDIPILDNFIDEYKSKYKGEVPKEPDHEGLCNEVTKIFKVHAILPQEVFEKAIQTWISKETVRVQSVTGDELATAPVLVDTLKTKIQEFAANVPYQALKKVVTTLVENLPSGTDITVKVYAEKLSTVLNSLVIPKCTLDELKDISTPTPTYVWETLFNKLNLRKALEDSADTNSAAYQVNTPGFKAKLEKELNAWKAFLKNALGACRDAALGLDGCTIDGEAFKKVIVDAIKIENVKKKFTELQFDKITMLKEQDTSKLNKQWITPWENALASIDVHQDIVESFGDDIDKLFNFSQDVYNFLPNAILVKAAFEAAIGDKRYLALEAIQVMNVKLQKMQTQVNEIEVKVEKIEAAVDLIQANQGLGILVNNIDLICDKAIALQASYVGQVTQHSIAYNTAYENYKKSEQEFQKHSDDLKAFHGAIFDAVVAIGTTALIVGSGGTLVGAGAIVKGFQTLMKSEVGKKIFEEGTKLALNPTKESMLDYPKLNAKLIGPFSDYLDKISVGQKQYYEILKSVVSEKQDLLNLRQFIQRYTEWKKTLDITLPKTLDDFLIKQYNSARSRVNKWLQDQEKNLNAYAKKLNEFVVYDTKVYEHDMYHVGIKSLPKSLNSWKLLCKSQLLLQRCVACDYITKAERKKHFSDGYFDDKQVVRFRSEGNKTVADYEYTLMFDMLATKKNKIPLKGK